MNTVLSSMPPAITVARPRYSAAPGPGTTIIGRRPASWPSEVAKIGRVRSSSAWRTALLRSMPPRSAERVLSTSRMALLTAAPSRMMKPTMVSMSSVCGVNRFSSRMPSTPPRLASGTVSSTSALSRAERNSAAISRNSTSSARRDVDAHVGERGLEAARVARVADAAVRRQQRADRRVDLGLELAHRLLQRHARRRDDVDADRAAAVDAPQAGRGDGRLDRHQLAEPHDAAGRASRPARPRARPGCPSPRRAGSCRGGARRRSARRPRCRRRARARRSRRSRASSRTR